MIPEDPRGKYQFKYRLGSGGLATVYKAWSTELEADVAVKVFDGMNTGVRTKRAYREMSMHRDLVHPGIPRFIEALNVRRAGGEFVACAMEFIDAVELADIVIGARTGSVTITDAYAANVTKETAKTTGYVHSRGIVHGDIKPENILVSDGSENDAYLVDFGSAKSVLMSDNFESSTDPAKLAGKKFNSWGRVTPPGTVVGTLKYISPQQLTDETFIDRRSDVYSLGIVLYELLTGKFPFNYEDSLALYNAMRSGDFVTPTDVRGWAGRDPTALNDVCLRAIRFHPEERFQTMDEMVAALDEAMGGHK